MSRVAVQQQTIHAAGWLVRPGAQDARATRPAGDEVRRQPVAIRYKEWGDVNLSTLMTLVMTVGLWLLGATS